MAEVYGGPLSGDRFTDLRRSGIGGSDAAAILGVSPFSSALACWQEKRGLGEIREASERMVWGSRLERAVLDGYAEDTGRPVRKTGRRFRRHVAMPFLIGHPDGEADDRLLEVKTTARLDERWGPDGSSVIPAHYFAQVQHYMVLTGHTLCDVAVLVGGREMHLYSVPADQEFQSAMLEEERAFWDLVREGTPPDPDGSESAREALRRMFPMSIPEEIIATPEIDAQAAVYLAARDAMREHERIAERSAQAIQRFMGARERIIGPGWSGTWNEVAGSTSWRAVAGTYRDLLVPHLDDDQLDEIMERNRGEASRRFQLRKGREA